MSPETSHPFAASYVIIRKADKVAFVMRSNTNWMNNHYGLPSGKVEVDESFTQAAVREAKEEIGINITDTKLDPILVMQRKVSGTIGDEWVDVFFEPKKWEGEPYNAEPDVHSELAWLDPNNLPENTIPSVKYAIGQILVGNTYCEFGWT